LYPHSAGKDYASQWDFVAAIHDMPWAQDTGRAFGIKDAKDQTIFAKRLASSLDSEAQEFPEASTLLISSEHFHSRVSTPQMIGRLKEYLSKWADTFEVMVYFRRQDEVAVSFQSTRLKSAVQLSDEQLAGAALGPSSYYAYDQIYSNWAEVFGAKAMRPRLFDADSFKNRDIVADFCDLAGLPAPDERSTLVNRSLNRKGFQFLQALNRIYPIMPGDEADTQRSSLVRHISETYAGHYSPMDRMQAEQFYKLYAPGNERLRKLAFPEKTAPLFKEDFSSYADANGVDDRSYDDAVEIAIALWKAKLSKPQTRSLLQSLRDRIIRRS